MCPKVMTTFEFNILIFFEVIIFVLIEAKSFWD